MLSGALKDSVIEEGGTKEEFTKRKRNERKKTLDEGKLTRKIYRDDRDNRGNRYASS